MSNLKMQAKRVPDLLAENGTLQTERDKAILDMDQMREAYYKDLMVYKSNALGRVKKENNLIMAKDDFIDVSFFD